MKNLSLYDLLIGQFSSETKNIDETDFSKLDDLTEEQKIKSSIIENLRMVLSTRQGSVQHLPDFGMPDILQLYFNSNNSIDPVKKEIKNVILKYEPRIANVEVHKTDFDQESMKITLKVVATIKDIPNKEILLTEFSTTGWTKVMFEKDTN
ncbi:MAG: type VI secretion system baseplate subunit TssE [Ignavibacteriota bacterium]|mgnify:FL=1|nr:MAG: type VI secretion system baseplate subunit TssE [Ignavibacterium sp.]MBL1154060.1 type VI secretion system baseplate subunit TssE [Ignavibacteriota bacterium]MCO6446551.1 type VI secretion system baseplate subunit TssE [Ignavibacterium album]MCZ2268954.1 type VI secretion system baseplate subunit TssE [Ignavibacteriales bacterium]MDX9712214.1 type VI secretion system baseplate subunit TssE [Ignavibacteriaceae bacterium]